MAIYQMYYLCAARICSIFKSVKWFWKAQGRSVQLGHDFNDSSVGNACAENFSLNLHSDRIDFTCNVLTGVILKSSCTRTTEIWTFDCTCTESKLEILTARSSVRVQALNTVQLNVMLLSSFKAFNFLKISTFHQFTTHKTTDRAEEKLSENNFFAEF